ncbi:MAG: hypothetical protein ABIQ01_11270 [Pseudolysinimonas sp.]
MTKQPVLPSDKLKRPRHTWRTIAIIAASLLVLGGAAGIGRVAVAGYAADDLRVSAAGHEKPQISHKLLVPHTLKSEVPPPPPPAPENFYGNPGPVQCGYGYTAGAVDAYGNESNCYANGPGNAQCVAYDENNNCTQYYKP